MQFIKKYVIVYVIEIIYNHKCNFSSKDRHNVLRFITSALRYNYTFHKRLNFTRDSSCNVLYLPKVLQLIIYVHYIFVYPINCPELKRWNCSNTHSKDLNENESYEHHNTTAYFAVSS